MDFIDVRGIVEESAPSQRLVSSASQ